MNVSQLVLGVLFIAFTGVPAWMATRGREWTDNHGSGLGRVPHVSDRQSRINVAGNIVLAVVALAAGIALIIAGA